MEVKEKPPQVRRDPKQQQLKEKVRQAGEIRCRSKGDFLPGNDEFLNMEDFYQIFFRWDYFTV